MHDILLGCLFACVAIACALRWGVALVGVISLLMLCSPRCGIPPFRYRTCTGRRRSLEALVGVFLFLMSHLIFSSPLVIFSPFFGATTHSVKRRKFPPHFLKSHVWPSIFHLYSLFLYFLFMTSSTTWLHVSHGIHFPHLLIVSLSFLCQVSLFYGAMWNPPTLPCVIRHPTPRKM